LSKGAASNRPAGRSPSDSGKKSTGGSASPPLLTSKSSIPVKSAYYKCRFLHNFVSCNFPAQFAVPDRILAAGQALFPLLTRHRRTTYFTAPDPSASLLL